MTTLGTLRLATFVTAILAVPSAALAQAGDNDKDKSGGDVDLGDDGLSDSGITPGAEENPGAPDSSFGDEPIAELKDIEPPPDKSEYPIQEVLRPILLPQYMAEVILDFPVHSASPFAAGGSVAGRFGITPKMQGGLIYGTGTLTEDGYEVGKAVALEYRYGLTRWLAPQITVPILFDPFALGVTLAAPLDFTFFDKVSLIFGEDLLTVAVAKFAPVVDNAAANAGLAALESTGTELPDAELRFGLRVIYQLKDELAIEGRLRYSTALPDNDSTQADPLAVEVGVAKSLSNKIDLGARLGFLDLATIDSFGGTVYAAVRL